MNNALDTSMDQYVTDESLLFIASNDTSLSDFLKTEIAEGKHIYCSFKKESIDYGFKQLLIKRKVSSISFCDGFTLYPVNEP